jgi:hypothetical protein
VRWFFNKVCLGLIGVMALSVLQGHASDFVVYNVYRSLNFGNTDEVSEKDYYINMGANQGVHLGSILEVSRKIPTYDLQSGQLYRDVVVPIAWVKVIHVEAKAVIARLDHMIPSEQRASITPPSIMTGDLVRIASTP